MKLHRVKVPNIICSMMLDATSVVCDAFYKTYCNVFKSIAQEYSPIRSHWICIERRILETLYRQKVYCWKEIAWILLYRHTNKNINFSDTPKSNIFHIWLRKLPNFIPVQMCMVWYFLLKFKIYALYVLLCKRI